MLTLDSIAIIEICERWEYLLNQAALSIVISMMFFAFVSNLENGPLWDKGDKRTKEGSHGFRIASTASGFRRQPIHA